MIDPAAADLVWAFRHAINAGDFRSAWRLMAPAYRLVRAQAWLWNNREHPLHEGLDLDATAAAFCVEDPTTPMWETFAEMELPIFREGLSVFSDTFGVASHARVVGPNIERLIFVETHGQTVRVQGPTLVEGASIFTVELCDGRWRLRGVGDTPPQPGWPPTIS